MKQLSLSIAIICLWVGCKSSDVQRAQECWRLATSGMLVLDSVDTGQAVFNGVAFRTTLDELMAAFGNTDSMGVGMQVPPFDEPVEEFVFPGNFGFYVAPDGRAVLSHATVGEHTRIRFADVVLSSSTRLGELREALPESYKCRSVFSTVPDEKDRDELELVDSMSGGRISLTFRQGALVFLSVALDNRTFPQISR